MNKRQADKAIKRMGPWVFNHQGINTYALSPKELSVAYKQWCRRQKKNKLRRRAKVSA